MKKLFKLLRKNIVINTLVRGVAGGFFRFSNRMAPRFMLHWPVSGIVNLDLPEGETLKLYTPGDEYIPSLVYWKGYEGYEGPAVKLFYYISKRSRTIIDVGAHMGYFSLLAAATNPEAHIYAFEPVDRIFKRLMKNVEVNRFSNITTEQLVVTDHTGKVSFYVPKTSEISHAASTKKGWVEDTEELVIDSISLDDYRQSRKIGKIDLVKLDCELNEFETLKGMRHILQHDKPVILLEVLVNDPGANKAAGNDAHLRIAKLLRENGYSFYLINPTALIRVNDFEYNPDERNYLCSPRCSAQVYLPYSDMSHLLKNILND